MGKPEISKKQAAQGCRGRYGTERADRCKVTATAIWSVPRAMLVRWELNRNLLHADIRVSSLVLYLSASLILGIFPGKSCWITAQLLIQSVSLIPKCHRGSRGNNKANPFPGIFTRVRTQAPPCSYPAAPNIQLGRIPLPSVGKPSVLADNQVWPAGNKQ